jgi:drug/metabolite transporter (DMT)-like permease
MMNKQSASEASCASIVPTEISQEEDENEDEHEDLEQHQIAEQRDIWRARLLLLGSAAIYGSSFPMIKLLNDEIPVGINMPLRFGLASFLTLPWFVFPCGHNAWVSTCLGLEVGFWNGLGYVSQAVGMQNGTEASKSAFIFSLSVVIVPLLDYVVGKHIYCRQWIGALLAVAGCAFLELHGSKTIDLGDDLTSYLQPLAFGIAFWRMERAVNRFPDQAARLTAALLFAIFICSVGFCAWSVSQPSVELFEWNQWFQDWRIVLSLIYTGCVTIACTNYMETVALRTLTATETTLILSVEPLFGTFFATILVGETLGKEFAIGAILILSACIYSNLGWNGLMDLVCCRWNRSSTNDESSAAIEQEPPSPSSSTSSGLFIQIRPSEGDEDHPPNRLV